MPVFLHTNRLPISPIPIGASAGAFWFTDKTVEFLCFDDPSISPMVAPPHRIPYIHTRIPGSVSRIESVDLQVLKRNSNDEYQNGRDAIPVCACIYALNVKTSI